MIKIKDYGYYYNVIFDGSNKNDYYKFFNFMTSKNDISKIKGKIG